MTIARKLRTPGRSLGLLVAVALSITAGVSEAAGPSDLPGYVDGSSLRQFAGDDASVVEVNLHGSLLRLGCTFDEELCDFVGGLELVQALIFDLSDAPPARGRMERAAATLDRLEKRLFARRWERVAFVREEGSTIRVLLLNSEKTIEGLAILILDDEELVFVNVVGVIDLARLQAFGEQYGLPGMDEIDLGEMGERKKPGRKPGRD